MAAGLEPFNWKDIPPGASWADSLQEALEECYALVAFVDDANASIAVPLEIGMALGKGKPVVLLLEQADDITRVPVSLREFPYLTVAGDVEKAAERLRIGLETARLPRSGAETKSRPRKVERASESALEREVSAAFANLGARVAAQPKINETARADLAVWLSEIIAPGLNPVIVEVASQFNDQAALILQVRRWLDELGLFFGIVVNDGSAAPRWAVNHGRAILTVGVQRLANFSVDEFRTVLTDGRNMLMHGTQ